MRLIRIALTFTLALGSAAPSPAQTFTTLYSFTGGSDGANPLAGVVQDPRLNLHGTTSGGGNPYCNIGCGVIYELDTEGRESSYAFCEHARNHWFLVKGSRGDSLPTEGDQLARLARSLGTTAADLREDYRRVTRRARAVMERLFYGKED